MGDGFNWQDAHARLRHVQGLLDLGDGTPAEDTARILRDRAAAVAKPKAVRTNEETLELLVFNMAREQYAIEAAEAQAVIPLRGLTPVPCTPPVVAGVVNHRGRILAVLDLRRLLDLPAEGGPEASKIVTVSPRGTAFGIVIEGDTRLVRVSAQAIAPPPSSFGPTHHPVLRGVANEMILVLDLHALARNPNVIVNEEIV